MEKTSNVGRKVRITKFYDDSIGAIGVVEEDNPSECYIRVKMKNGDVHHPYRPGHQEAQCELLPEENEYHIDKLRDKKFWVATPTQEDWNKVCEVFQRANIKWCSNVEATGNKDHWKVYKTNNGIGYNYENDQKLGYSPKSTYTDKVEIFITAESFIQANQPTMNKNTQALEQIELLKAQILKIEESLKEPVWEPKVGEWVYVVDTASTSINKNGDVKTIKEIKWGRVGKGETSDVKICKLAGEGSYERLQDIRPATPEEIAAAQVTTVTIGSSSIPVKISKGLIEADGKRIAIADLEITIQQIKQIEVGKITSWSVEVQNDTRFLKIGCSLFSPNEIQQVITEYKRINE